MRGAHASPPPADRLGARCQTRTCNHFGRETGSGGPVRECANSRTQKRMRAVQGHLAVHPYGARYGTIRKSWYAKALCERRHIIPCNHTIVRNLRWLPKVSKCYRKDEVHQDWSVPQSQYESGLTNPDRYSCTTVSVVHFTICRVWRTARTIIKKIISQR